MIWTYFFCAIYGPGKYIVFLGAYAYGVWIARGTIKTEDGNSESLGSGSTAAKKLENSR